MIWFFVFPRLGFGFSNCGLKEQRTGRGDVLGASQMHWRPASQESHPAVEIKTPALEPVARIRLSRRSANARDTPAVTGRFACHSECRLLVLRGEENRGHHQALQNRASERSVDGSRRGRNDSQRGKGIWPAERAQRNLSRHRVHGGFPSENEI